MELLERGGYLEDLAGRYRQVEQGIGHTVFLMGEAGVGKTSLVNHFIENIERSAVIYSGACDSLFTPRPLGPLFDIAGQIGEEFIELLKNEKDRSLIFAALVQKISVSEKPFVLLFEDIHWADEATIDLIKFLARRIYRHKCLFLLTYRDDEVHTRHPLKNIFGELPSDKFSKVLINGFSRETVNKLALAKGYTTGEMVYSLTEGNPFYVKEILASYSPGIPERVKDSILTVFQTRGEKTRELWEFLSVLPSSRIELSIARRIEIDFENCMEGCMNSGVIVSRPGHLSFKHELYRLTIEESLSPSRRRSLHKKMIEIIQEGPVDSRNLSQLVHHAKYAEEKELVAKVAPQAARDAAAVGAHIEASKLYLTAIEYTDKQDPMLAELYERHAYECYLTNQITAAIESQQHALDIRRAEKAMLKEGDILRFLSRLWWFQGDQQKSIAMALQSIEVLENGYPTRERVLAYSNFAQLNMLADNGQEALLWGNRAINLAVRMQDNEILSHALNNVGTVLLKSPPTARQGEENLNRSLAIALANGFQEHIARAYTNLSSSFVLIKQYEKASEALEVGLKYCEARDLGSWTYYMLSWKVRLLFETGNWDETERISRAVLSNLLHPSIVKIGTSATLARLELRRGKFDEADRLIHEAKAMARSTREAQRIIPVLVASLERCWINGDPLPLDEISEAENTLFHEKNNSWHYSELTYWLNKCGVNHADQEVKLTAPYRVDAEDTWEAAAEMWKETGCPYEQALALFNGDEEHQKQALVMLDEMGASATHEMLKLKLRNLGVRNIPRGPRESTRSNPAQLTNRQIDVLVLLKDGLQNAEIADKLFISAKTVDHHISSILSKLNVNTRTKAVGEARKLGILN